MPNPSDPARSNRAADTSIGERIKNLRGDMTQTALAAASGVSVEVIRKLEQGQRAWCSIVNLHKFAAALDVDAGTFLGKPRPLARPGEHQGAVAIRRTLTAVDDLIGDSATDGPAGGDLDVEPLTVADGQRTLTLGWDAYWAGRFEDLGQILPTAIIRARAATRAVPSADRAAAAEVAAQVLQLSACTLVHLGYTDIAHLALREARDLALRGADPLWVDSATITMSWVLLVEGRFAESTRLASAGASAMHVSGSSPLPVWALYGSHLLTAATAKGRAGDRAGAHALADEAEDAARRTGNRPDYHTNFGPDQLLMQRVDVEVVTENYASALAAARRVPQNMALPVVPRARHLTDVALAHTRLGHDSAALDVLEAAAHLAPRWMPFQTQPKMIVGELRQRQRASTGRRLDKLARMIGAAGD